MRVGKGNKCARKDISVLFRNMDRYQTIVNPLTKNAHHVSRDLIRSPTLLRQSTLLGWGNDTLYNIDTHINDSTQLREKNVENLSSRAKEDKLIAIRRRREQQVEKANLGSPPTRTPRQRLGGKAEDVISFEHINVNGINSHDQFVELTNTMGILDNMEAGVYSLVETQWDTTCPTFCKRIRQTILGKDKYAKVSFASNMDETFLTSWKPGGTMIGASGRWASRVKNYGNDNMGRWSWMDMRGKKGRLIRVISAYRVSQDSYKQAGETTSCKQ